MQYMEYVKNIESKIEDLLKPIPHLPNEWRKWLGENAWWLTLLGAILSALGILGLGMAILAAFALVGVAAGMMAGVAATALTGYALLSAAVSVAFMIVSTFIMFSAVNPLKLGKKQGWDLLFLSYLVGILSSLVNIVLNFSNGTFISGLIGTAVSAAIGAYVLFEIRSHFIRTSHSQK